MRQRWRRPVGGRAASTSSGRRGLHRRAEQVARPMTWPLSGAPANGRRAGQRHVHAEVGPPVRRDEEAAADRVAWLDAVGLACDLVVDVQARAPAARTASASGSWNGRSRIMHRVVAERAVGRQRLRPLGGAPRRQRHRRVIDSRSWLSRTRDVDRRAGVRHLMPVGVSWRRIALKCTSSPSR